MLACDAEAMLMVNVTKMYHQPDCENFDALGRVLSGTLKVGLAQTRTRTLTLTLTLTLSLTLTLTLTRAPNPSRTRTRTRTRTPGQVGQEIKVLGETYSLDDQEDSAVKTITRLWLHQSRYRVEVTEVPAGCWALIEGIDSVLVKT